MSTSDRSDHTDAARYAAEAGELLLELRGSATGDLSSRSLGQRGDLLAHHRLLELLASEHPADAVLSEEADDDPRRLVAQRVWIVDPLDGTREFAEPGRDDWAVHVALWERGLGVRASAVALPAQGRVFSTASPWTVPDGVPPGHRYRIAVSRTRPPLAAQRAAEKLNAELVPMGSAGAKAMAVVQGTVDAYVHAGGQYEWDSAAPTTVAAAAGLYTARLDGSPLIYNQPDPWLPDFVICRREIAEVLLAAAAGEPNIKP
jgi:3'(2'), 5'-bisphosphate nucleotidase